MLSSMGKEAETWRTKPVFGSLHVKIKAYIRSPKCKFYHNPSLNFRRTVRSATVYSTFHCSKKRFLILYLEVNCKQICFRIQTIGNSVMRKRKTFILKS